MEVLTFGEVNGSAVILLSTVSVLLNEGGGTLADNVDYHSGRSAGDMESADINGDGNVDVVTSNLGDSEVPPSVLILLGAGDATLAPPVGYGAGFRPESLTVVDVDGDGDLDVVAANESSNTVSVFRNAGDGTLEPQVEFFGGLRPEVVEALDVDGDGGMDLLTSIKGSGAISVLLNQCQ